MARRLRVTIDLELLRSHLAAEDEYPHSEAYVLNWLASAGFTFVGAGTWVVREADLGQLACEEYEIVQDFEFLKRVGVELVSLN